MPALSSVAPDLARAVADTLRTGAPLAAATRAERERKCGTLASLDSLDASGAVLFVPLRRDGTVNGVLLIAFAGDHEFGEDELDLAFTLGLLGGPALASRPPTS
jgi:GAF domain-containing protein